MRVEELDMAIESLERRRLALHAAPAASPSPGQTAAEGDDLDAALQQLRVAREELLRLQSQVAALESVLERQQGVNAECFEAAADASVRVDEHGRITAVNGRAEKLFGYDRDEIIGAEIEALIPERFREEHRRRRTAFMRAPRECEMGDDRNMWGLRKDGGEFAAEVNLLPQRDGGVLSVTAILRDTTEKRAAARELQRQRDLLRLVTDSVPALVAYVDRDLRIVFANRPYREWFGVPAEGAGEPSLKDVIGGSSYAQIERFIERALAGETVSFERALQHGDGRPAVLQGTYVPDIEQGGHVRGLFILLSDVTGSKRAERALLETSRQLTHRVADLEALLDIAPVGVAIADDPTCQHIRPNRELSRMLRLAVGVNASSTAPADERPTHFTMTRNGVPIPDAELPMQVAARTGQPVLHSQMDIVFDDGSMTSIYGQTTPLFDADGNVRGAIGAFLDITDVRRIEDELRQANAVKDEFLGLVSHELKTPITTILGNAEVLQKRAALLDEADRVAALTDIQDEASRLHNIIDNLLVLARLERGQRIEREPVLIQRVVGRVTDWHRHRNPHRTVHVRYDDALPPALASSMYVEQVLANLLSNAEKYSPMQALIDIDVARNGARVVVTVSDRGIGIAPDELERVFTPFYRSPRTASHAKGFGIGLAVCKRLIDVQEGRMWAEARPDGGTCFSFELPLSSDEARDV